MDEMVAFVRYGAMETTARFTAPDTEVPIGSDVIVRTARGVEWGLLVQFRKRVSDGEEIVGEMLRKATAADAEKQREIADKIEVEEFRTCGELIAKHDLPMKLVDVEHLFGGHKIIFYFMADGRVDFRELVRDLAKKYRTRIEMRQIGVRDEARLMGLVGPCGNEICCRRFLKALKPVPMKLAKDQKSTLDPAKISGTCGRLKCCLKYEEELYRELKENLPRRGARVQTSEGPGQVLDFEIIGQNVMVQLDDDRRLRLPAGKVQLLEEQKRSSKGKTDKQTSAEAEGSVTKRRPR